MTLEFKVYKMSSQSNEGSKKSGDVDVSSNNGQSSQTESQKPGDYADKKSNKTFGEPQGTCYWLVL